MSFQSGAHLIGFFDLHGRTDQDHTLDPLRVLRRKHERPAAAGGQPNEGSARGAGRIHHRQCVGGEGFVGIVELRRFIGAAVPASIEGYNAAVTCEVWNLQLPHPGVDDRPRRQEEKSAISATIDVVGNTHAVAFDETRAIGLARFHRARSFSQRCNWSSIIFSSSRWPVS